MKKFSNKMAVGKLSALSAALLTLGMAGNAQADAYTYSYSLVNLLIYNVTANRAADVSDFDRLVAQNSSAANADLLSIPGIANNSDLLSADVAPTYQAAGGLTFSDNDAIQHLSGHFARSDTSATGAVITGLTESIPAKVGVWSEILLANNDIGQSSSNANNNTGFEFTLTTGAEFRFDINAETFTQSFLTSDALVPPSIAGSNATWELTLTKGGSTICNWSPDGQAGGITGCNEINDAIDLNFGSTVSTPGADTGLIHNVGSASASIFLDSGSYTFRLTQTSSANSRLQSEVVPEPASLFLLGVGLLGMLAGRRRFNVA